MSITCFGPVAKLGNLLLLPVFAVASLVLASNVHAENKCVASGLMGGEKFAASHCTASLYGDQHSVAIWFNESPVTQQEEEAFQISASADEKKDGKQRTLVVIMFCPGGGASTASPAAVKSIDLHTNHAKSTFLGIQTVIESPKDFKVEKMAGEVKPGGSLAGKISGKSGQTTINLDFDVQLPTKDAAAGLGCGG